MGTEEYFVGKKIFYDVEAFKYSGNIHMNVNQEVGVYEIYQGFFYKDDSPIQIVESTGAFILSESIFEECFSTGASPILIDCQNSEFDVTISSVCAFSCSCETGVKFFKLICSNYSLVSLKDLSITMSQKTMTSTIHQIGSLHLEAKGYNESNSKANRHAGPYLVSQKIFFKFLTLKNCQTKEGIFVFLSGGESFGSHLIVTNNSVTATLSNYACIFSNNYLYVKESYVINNKYSYSINTANMRELDVLNCVCDNISSSALSSVILTSFPEPQLRHLSLGKCKAQNPLMRCLLSDRRKEKGRYHVCILLLFLFSVFEDKNN